MAKGTKRTITIALGSTESEKTRRTKALREMAETCGIAGRYGGNISEFLAAIADLPQEEREAIALVLKKFLAST